MCANRYMELQWESESATKTKMVWVDQRTLFFFSMTDGRFSCEKATSPTKSHIPTSKRRDSSLSERVLPAVRRDGDKVAL